nr:hypothetical protein [Tanacetum cinerariifolium]
AAAEEEVEKDEVSAALTPPSPTHEPTPPSQEHITSPPQAQSVTPPPSPPHAQPALPSSPPQEQPTTTTSTTDITLLNTLMETCTTLFHKVAALEQDKVAQALEILKLKRRVKKLEKKRRSKSSGLKRLRKRRLEEKDEVNAAEPTVFDDEEVTMTMAQTLIKMKAKKTRLLDKKMAKMLHDEEFEQAAARESLKRKPISVAQARKNMIVYLKNMTGYKIAHFKGMTYVQFRPIFEREYNKVQTFLKPDRDEEPTKKRAAKETLLQESFKKLRAEVEVSGSHSTQDTPTYDPKKMSEEDVKNMLQIVPVSEFKVEALQVKYPLIDWEIYSEGSKTYWKIIRVGGITQAYRSFEDMLKDSDREDLDALWRLTKEKFSTTMPTEDKEKALWVELKRLHDIFMFLKKDYPLTDAVLLLMLSTKLQVDEDREMAMDLVMKICMEANKPKSRKSLDTSSK